MIREFLIKINLPDWARWYAVDACGRIWMYSSKPFLNLDECDHIWFSGGEMKEVDEINFRYPLPFDWTKTRHKIERAA